MASAPDWIAAIASGVTSATAIVAGAYAMKQFRLHRSARQDSLSPHVVVDLRPTPDVHGFVDLVIANVGRSTARDVHLTFEPELRTAFDDSLPRPLRALPLFADGIPTLPPGREWRTVFEKMSGREGRDDLPVVFDVQVEYEGPFGSVSDIHKLDFNLLADLITARSKGEIAKELEGIKKQLRFLERTVARDSPDLGDHAES